MGGANAEVFTGGIGENSSATRARICDGLQWAGTEVDADKNGQTAPRARPIGKDGCRLAAWVIPTDEELPIARDTVRCVLGVPHPS
jgi:acetate kinase